jgi:hypothetical protein
MDGVFGLPYARAPHPAYGEAKIPAWEMIRFSVNIMRGCFGGCTFCSITEHEGRIIQSRSEESILHEIEEIRDKTPGFTGVDLRPRRADRQHVPPGLQGPKIESRTAAACPASIPDICENLNTDHAPLIAALPQGAGAARHQEGADRLGPALRPGRALAGIRQGTGDPPRRRLSQDRAGAHRGRPAVEDDEAGHRQPTMRFKQMFERFSKEAGKEQYLIPYFIAAHPGTTDEDMLNLALWLKKQQLPPRPGADLPADADGAGHRHVPQRQEPAAQGDA